MVKLFKYILFLFLIQSTCAFAQQSTIKKGAYFTHNSFVANSPAITDSFVISYLYLEKEYQLFSVKSYDGKVRQKDINKSIWAIYDGHSLYLNCFRLFMTKEYAKVIHLGRYSYFTAPPLMSDKQQLAVSNSTVIFGVVGGIVASSNVNKQIRNNVHYVLDMKTGIPHELDKVYLLHILKSNEYLLSQFNAELNQDDINVIIKYVVLLNKEEAGL
ncbi:MAG: DUF6563 family protein [Bacteroidota bacterium]